MIPSSCYGTIVIVKKKIVNLYNVYTSTICPKCFLTAFLASSKTKY